uniref:Putative membrane protein C6F6.13c n=1 Tax=Talaromyces marneffei PM1 TaxID=1077442 RepID=A0A093V2S9_TALMA
MHRLQALLSHLSSYNQVNKSLSFAARRLYSSQPPKYTSKDIATLLAKPTWSVQSLLPNTHDPTIPLSITPQTLHHLLRLSALPQPVDKTEETSMLRTLEAQIHFVKSIQDVDTKDASPLRAIRDESREAIKESTISLETLKEALAKEQVVGRRRKIQRQTTTIEDGKASHVESDQWDGNALGSATKTAGKFFVVQSVRVLLQSSIDVLPIMAQRFFDRFADTTDRAKEEHKPEEHGLSDFLSKSQRGDLMILISTTLEQMLSTILESFEALPISRKDSPRSRNEDARDWNEFGHDVSSKTTEEGIRDAVGLDPESRKEALAYFDEWQNSVFLRIGQVINEREGPQDGRAPVKKFHEEPTEPEQESSNRLQQIYPPLDNTLRDGPKAQRLLILRSLLLLLLSLEHYNAYSRVLLLRIASSLNLQASDLNDNEVKIARGLLDAAVAMTADEEAKKKAADNQNLRKWKVGLATVAGAALIGITGGLAAPLVAAGLGTVMGGLGLGGTIAASYLGALASSGVVVGGLFGAYGGKMTGRMMDSYAREVEDFAFIPIRGTTAKKFKDEKEAAKEDHRLRVTIGITGWVTEEDNITEPWRVIGPESEVFALRWEYESLLNLGNSMRALVTTAAWKVASQQLLIWTVFAGIMSAVMLPFGLMRIAKIAANPFSVAISRADKAGEVLADALINGAQGKRPVTLIGYSLGSRVIYSCLQSLAKRRAYGLIESVVFMGAPIPADSAKWHSMRAVVAGRLVNVYSEKDAVLALLYRATHLEVDISGLQPVSGVPNLENIDVSATVSGHLRYQFLVGQVLTDIGFEEIDASELEMEKLALWNQDEQIEREQAENEKRKPVAPAKRKYPPSQAPTEPKTSAAPTTEGQKDDLPADISLLRKEEEEVPHRHYTHDRNNDKLDHSDDESGHEDELNFITMIDEEDEARLHQEIAQRTQEQMLNWRTRQMRN